MTVARRQTAWKLVVAGALIASACDSASDSGVAAADGTDGTDGTSVVDGSTGSDSTDGVDGTDGAAVGEPQGVDGPDGPRTDWPADQPGADDPDAREWHRAGKWYKDDPAALSQQVAGLLNAAEVPSTRKARGILTPHAGIVASGPIAAQAWARVEVPELIIVLAPNHADTGEHAAVWPSGPWLAPGVAVETDEAVAARVVDALPGAVADRAAFDHILAHPSEMQLPFISRIQPSAKIVMVNFYDFEKVVFPDVDALLIDTWAEGLAELIAELEQEGREVLLVGSTDLSHYEPLAVNDPHDAEMMAAIAAFDTDELRSVVEAGSYTICGEIAASVFMATMKKLGYEGLDWWVRGNSSHLGGEESVVGYPAGVVWQ